MSAGNEIKAIVLRKIAGALSIRQKPKAKWQIGSALVHVRFRSEPKSDGATYAFNINPNTLSAAFELWICGSADSFYLIPMSELRDIYNDPNGYRDYAHPEIRVADIQTRNHRCIYGRGNLSRDFGKFYCVPMNGLTNKNI